MSMRSRATRAVAASLGLALAVVAPTVADDEDNDAKHAVEYRKAVMSSIGGHAGAIMRIIRQDVAYDHLRQHAEALALTAPLVADIWPDNSTPSAHQETAALPRIWDEPERFGERIENFRNAAAAFAVATGSGDMGEIMPAFQALGRSCSNCHDDYRAK